MKKLTAILFLTVVFTAAAQAQTLEKFFDKYADDERFEYVLIAGSMRVLTLDLKKGNYDNLVKGMMDELQTIVQNLNFEKTVDARDGKERTYIYIRKNKGKTETLIIAKEESEFTVMWANDKIMGTVKDLVNNVMENLEHEQIQ